MRPHLFAGLILTLALGCSSGSGTSGAGGAAGSASGGSGGGSGSGNVCDTTCNTLAGVCTGTVQDCISGCQKGYSMFPSCKTQLDAANQCAATRPASDFTCDTTNQPQLKAGVCSTEVSAIQKCATGA